MKIFFIQYQTKTYGKNTSYNIVDFRIKRASVFNYKGQLF